MGLDVVEIDFPEFLHTDGNSTTRWPSDSRRGCKSRPSRVADSNRGIDERNDVEGEDKTGDLADEAEVFECLHGDRGSVSTVLRICLSNSFELVEVGGGGAPAPTPRQR